MLHDDSSTSSRDEDDIDYLFLDAAFCQGRRLDNKLDLSQLTEMQCKEMFRYLSFL
jgi:hypothetical protein